MLLPLMVTAPVTSTNIDHCMTDQMVLLHDRTSEASTSLYDVQMKDDRPPSRDPMFMNMSL